jgi:flagellar hook-basal body complex protein FliE
MKLNRGKSFKQVLKLAKKTYKKSQSQSSSQSSSQSAGRRRRRRAVKRGGNSMKQSIDALLQKQQGGSGMSGKAPFGESAAPVS